MAVKDTTLARIFGISFRYLLLSDFIWTSNLPRRTFSLNFLFPDLLHFPTFSSINLEFHIMARKSFQQEWISLVARHKPSVLTLASQVLAAAVHSAVKVLLNSGSSISPFQILFIRMSITGIGCSLYLWVAGVPDFPFGQREIRKLLGIRALSGICGACGMYCKASRYSPGTSR